MDIQVDQAGHQTRIHIDQHPYESPTPTTGAALYRLAGIGAELVLFKEVGGDREDSAVPKDDTPLHVKEDEHFHSARQAEPGVEIFVNTNPFRWERPKITYEEVVKLAYPDGPQGGDVRYNVVDKAGWPGGRITPWSTCSRSQRDDIRCPKH